MDNTMNNIPTLSNLQKELLKLYATNISEEQLHEIKLLLAKFFAEKATEAMDKQWQEQQLSEQDMINWTNEHNRHQGSY